MYVDYKELLPDVVQILFAEGLDKDAFNENRAVYAIRSAYKDFVRDSHILRREITRTTQANVTEYPLWKEDNHILTKIYSVTVEDHDGCVICYELARAHACSKCPCTYSYDGRMLELCPPPPCDGLEITICASLVPGNDLCQMDERIYELYGRYIAEGAASYILSATEGLRYRRYFNIGKDIAQSDAAAQWSKRNIRSERAAWFRR